MISNHKSNILKHIPNALTLFRVGLIAPFVLCLFYQEYVDAFYVFITAGFTDGLDGWLARHFDWQSFFGSLLDPMADKLLITSSFISLALIGSLPWWSVILVFLRDLSIPIGVFTCHWVLQCKLVFKATPLSKFNTGLQLFLATLCLFELAYFKLSVNLIDGLIYITAVTTSITYVHYLWIACDAWSKKELLQ